MGGKKRRFEQCDELRQTSFATQSLQVAGAQSASEPHGWRTVAEQCWRSICVVLLIVERPTRTSRRSTRGRTTPQTTVGRGHEHGEVGDDRGGGGALGPRAPREKERRPEHRR